MKHAGEQLLKIALLGLAWLIWLWVIRQPPSRSMDFAILVGGLSLVYPVVWIGRVILDRQPTASRAVWITTFVHYGVGIPFGSGIIRAVISHHFWSGWALPIPVEIGLPLVMVTGAATLLTVLNLALKGLGAPFAIALTRNLAVDWMYAWTRNPMVLAALAFLISLGTWFQSAHFVLWVLFLFTPSLLFFVKVYEERELECRFGESYLQYRSRTPMLFPRKPRR